MILLQKISTKTLRGICLLGYLPPLLFPKVFNLYDWSGRLLWFGLLIVVLGSLTLLSKRQWYKERKTIKLKSILFLGAMVFAFFLIYAITYGIIWAVIVPFGFTARLTIHRSSKLKNVSLRIIKFPSNIWKMKNIQLKSFANGDINLKSDSIEFNDKSGRTGK